MASIRPMGSKWQLQVRHKLLPKTFYHSFETELEASYGAQLEALLSRGFVSIDLVDRQPGKDNPMLRALIAECIRHDAPRVLGKAASGFFL